MDQEEPLFPDCSNKPDLPSFLSLSEHIFFPRRLPSVSTKTPDLEIQFLHLFSKYTADFFSSLQANSFVPSLDIITVLFKNWLFLQQSYFLDPSKLHEKLHELLNANTKNYLPIYIPGQNTCLFLKFSDKAAISCSTFSISLPSEAVLSAVGDLKVQIPNKSCNLPDDRLIKSLPFCQTIAQLSEISTSKPGELANEWLIYALSGDSPPSNDPLAIIKKVRDDVIKGSQPKPENVIGGDEFRRSEMWTCLKYVLHLSLCDLMDKEEGTLMYKLLMLNFLANLLHISQDYGVVFDCDFRIQMLSKVARRLKKFMELSQAQNVKIKFEKIIQTTSRKCYKVIKNIKDFLESHWKTQVVSSRAQESRLDQAKIKLEDVKLSLKSFNVKFSELRKAENRLVKFLEPPSPTNFQRNYKKLAQSANFYLPNLFFLSQKELKNAAIALNDIEDWVFNLKLQNFLTQEDQVPNVTYLYNLLQKYSELAHKHYQNDPLLLSRRTITALTILRMMDEIVCNAVPIVKYHKIKLPLEFLHQTLLVNNMKELEYFSELMHYFERKEKTTELPPLLKKKISKQSFSVLYYNQDQEMKNLRKQIEDWIETKKKQKREHLQTQLVQYQDLKERAAKKEHHYFTDYYGNYRHSNQQYCSKCRWENEASNMQEEIYENPLPSNEEWIKAIVFELSIPKIISIYRETINYFLLNILKYKAKVKENEAVKVRWITELSQFSNYVEPILSLGSTSSRSITRTYISRIIEYGGMQIFFKDCSLNCYFSRQETTIGFEKNLDPTVFSFHIDSKSPYHTLQKFLTSTDHCENEVIAIQHNCPQEMELSEFLKFGMFRAGHRLQLKNLLEVLETRSLSLNKQEVYFLFAQTLYQIGPISRNLDGNKRFETLKDFNNSFYSVALLENLQTLAKIYQDNWNESLILLNLVTIAQSFLSFSQDQDIVKCLQLLILDLRAIGKKWQMNILEKLKEVRENVIESTHLRKLLYLTSASTLLTYNSTPEHFKVLMHSQEDIVTWLSSFNNLESNMDLSDNLSKHLYIVILLCSHATENHLIERLQSDDFKAFEVYISQFWSDAKLGQISNWQQLPNTKDRWFSCEFQRLDERKLKLHLDTYGKLLIHGKPLGKLPSHITSSSIYKKLFDKLIFDVSQSSKSENSMVTGTDTKKMSFEFIELNQEEFILKQRNEKWGELLYVPEELFEDELPLILIHRYSHWYSEKQHKIYFRPTNYANKGFEDSIFFVLNLETYELNQFESKETLMIDINSGTFTEIYEKVLHRLEIKGYIHIFTDKSGAITVNLPRMGLNFELENERLNSREYEGKCVAFDQTIGTLIGFELGLILEDKTIAMNDRKPCFLIPHGHLQNTETKLDIKKLSDPPFFYYEIDQRLSCIRGGEAKSSWIFLALLHILYSHPLKDPFLGMTGFEMALKILQSAICWSCEPYDRESFHLLQEIEKIAPKVELKDQSLEVKYPANLPSCVANEAFFFVAHSLVEDSQRLHFAFGKANKENLEKPKCENHMKRRYWRYCEFLSPNARLTSFFEKKLGAKPKTQLFTEKNQKEQNLLRNVKLLSHFYYQGGVEVSDFDFAFIQNEAPLQGRGLNLNEEEEKKMNEEPEGPLSIFGNIKFWSTIVNSSCLANKWINLFENLVLSQAGDLTFYFLLSFLAFQDQKISFDYLKVLAKISMNNSKFAQIMTPIHQKYENPKEFVYKKSSIKTILESNTIQSLRDYILEVQGGDWIRIKDKKDLIEKHQKNMNELKQEVVKKLENGVNAFWDSGNRNFSTLKLADFEENEDFLKIIENVESTQRKIRDYLINLSMNVELNNFLNEVKTKFIEIQQAERISPEFTFLENFCQAENPKEKFRVAFKFEKLAVKEEIKEKEGKAADKKEKINEFPLSLNKDSEVMNYLLDDLEKSWHFYHLNVFSKEKPKEEINENGKNLVRIQTQFLKNLSPKSDSFIELSLYEADLWFRIVPSVYAQFIIEIPYDEITIDNSIIEVLFELIRLWIEEQKQYRIAKFKVKEDMFKHYLQRELENKGHENWKARDYPRWLLFELEADVMIRKIQIEVAQKMMFPSKDINTTTQLNMGEGKTAVIIPILCSQLSNGYQIARVTVPKSLYSMNYSALIYKLGFLLNQRVYSFPYRRDMNLSHIELQHIYSTLEESLLLKGIIVSIPDHRLSFRLKGLEQGFKNPTNPDTAFYFKVEEWLARNCRDLLDESDEILSVKYQLVYTVGEQSRLDGGALRWKVAETILGLVRDHIHEFAKKYPSCFELFERKEHKSAFPHIRLLRKEPYLELCKNICDYILRSKKERVLDIREMKEEDLKVVEPFIFDEEKGDLEAVKAIFSDDINGLDTVLILRGILKFEILYMALNKRWRVEYGVNDKSERNLLQAVPYRAKDLPAERAQYAHPDVSVILTLMSYYYSGLNDEQLDAVFAFLEKIQDRSKEYESWIIDTAPPETIREYVGINLADHHQKYEVLYPHLRFNTNVINFWLNNQVFPREFKEFKSRFSCSGWDLTPTKQHLTTGFSGTNETRMLLPENTIFEGLPELEYTNGLLVENLLRPENDVYTAVPSDITGEGILKKITDQRVLLDVGALMSELTNEDVAKKWLDLTPSNQIHAAIYFDMKDKLYVVDRYRRNLPLILSPYRNNLDKCVIYLDDCHTRGTDLKFPIGTKAIVTLGKSLTKDRLVQACMRMRLLGKGHSVCFWAAAEVDQTIKELKKRQKIGSQEVLEWALYNTGKSIVDGFSFWSDQGVSHMRNQNAYQQCTRVSEIDYNKMVSSCLEKEMVDLKSLFGHSRSSIFLMQILELKLKANEDVLRRNKLDIHEFSHSCERLKNKMRQFVSKEKRMKNLLDDEHEIELEVENEEEEHLERPCHQKARKPLSLAEDIQKFAENGEFNLESTSYVPLYKSLEKTNLWKIVNYNVWNENMFVSKDFMRVIEEGVEDELDNYLRPPRWIIKGGVSPDKLYILLVSGSEANALLGFINKGDCKSNLIMFTPRLRREQRKTFYFKKGFELNAEELEQISVFGGSLYLNGLEEQKELLSWLGYFISPRTEEEKKLFDEEIISRQGFVSQSNKEKVKEALKLTKFTKFKENPGKFVDVLFALRHNGIIPEGAHHRIIIGKGVKPLNS